MNNTLLLANLASTLFLTGIAWSMQVVQLPQLLRERPEFVGDMALHQRRNSALMIVPMSVEFFSIAALLCSGFRPAAFVCAALLWIPIAGATVWYILLHRQLRKGYAAQEVRSMRAANLIRVVCWTARSGIILCIAGTRVGI